MRLMALLSLALLVLGTVACGKGKTEAPLETLQVEADIADRRVQFAPMELSADLSVLDDGDRVALDHLVDAAKVMDRLFIRQVWQGNEAFAPRVATLSGPGAQAARDYHRIMFGPWDRLTEMEPFLGDEHHPPGAGYYPEDLTKAELEAWLDAHPEDVEAFTSTFTVIRRLEEGLVAVPYSKEYRDLLEEAASHLRLAAAATSNESLKRFLETRADAFFTDDYYESDMAWMDLDSLIEVVIGPYETYEDGLFGYKGAFEAFICVAAPEDSKKLDIYKGELPYLESSLPMPDEHKNPNRGSESPIRVADEVFSAGDGKAGVQTLAFNLPNDERVREAKGSKNVLLKNMMHAKYSAVLAPIAGRVLPADEVEHLDFDAYFHFILFHELAHGLGPGRITVDGRETEVRKELKELYSAIEEAKADVLGARNLFVLADKGVVPTAIVDPLPWTYVAGLFRSARFGTTEAHGLGVAIQASYLQEHGAIEITPEGRFRPVVEKFRPALESLAQELLMVEALGSYDRAKALGEKYGPVKPEMRALLDSFTDIPVDIDPVFTYTAAGS